MSNLFTNPALIKWRLGLQKDVPTLQLAEPGWDFDKKVMRIGDDTNIPPKIQTTKSVDTFDFTLALSLNFAELFQHPNATFDGVNFAQLNKNNGLIVRTQDKFVPRAVLNGRAMQITNGNGGEGNIDIHLDPEIKALIDSIEGPLTTVTHTSAFTGLGTVGSPLSVNQSTTALVASAATATQMEANDGVSTTKALTPENLRNLNGAVALQWAVVLNVLSFVTHDTSMTGNGLPATPLSLAQSTDILAGASRQATQDEVDQGLVADAVIIPETLKGLRPGLTVTNIKNALGLLSSVNRDTSLVGNGTVASILRVQQATEIQRGGAKIATQEVIDDAINDTDFITPFGFANVSDGSAMQADVREWVLPSNLLAENAVNKVKFRRLETNVRRVHGASVNHNVITTLSPNAKLNLGSFALEEGQPKVFVAVAWQSLNDTTVTVRINGILAEIDPDALIAINSTEKLAVASGVPLINTGDIDISFSGSVKNCSYQIYSVTGADTPVWVKSASQGVTTKAVNSTVPAYGKRLSFFYSNWAVVGENPTTVTGYTIAGKVNNYSPPSGKSNALIAVYKDNATGAPVASNISHVTSLVANVLSVDVVFAPKTVAGYISTFDGQSSFVVPVGVTKITARGWGPGGAGGAAGANRYTSAPFGAKGGNGGAGGYLKADILVTPGETLTTKIGRGGYAGFTNNYPEIVNELLVDHNNAQSTFVIPAGATQLVIEAVGGGGYSIIYGLSTYARDGYGKGGPGAYVRAIIPLDGSVVVNATPIVPGVSLRVVVGSGGNWEAGATQGFGGEFSAGKMLGGGLTGIFVGAAAVTAASANRAVVIAGGGGSGCAIYQDGYEGLATGGGGGHSLSGGGSDLKGTDAIIYGAGPGFKAGAGGGGYEGGYKYQVRQSWGTIPGGPFTFAGQTFVGPAGGEGGRSYVHPDATYALMLTATEFSNVNPSGDGRFSAFGNSSNLPNSQDGTHGRLILGWSNADPSANVGSSGGEGGEYTAILRGASPIFVVGGGGGGGAGNGLLSTINNDGGQGGAGGGWEGLDGLTDASLGVQEALGASQIAGGTKAVPTALDGASLTGGDGGFNVSRGGSVINYTSPLNAGAPSFDLYGGAAGGGSGYFGGGGAGMGESQTALKRVASGAGGGSSFSADSDIANLAGSLISPPYTDDIDRLLETGFGGAGGRRYNARGYDYGNFGGSGANGGNGQLLLEYVEGTVSVQAPGYLKKEGTDLTWDKFSTAKPFFVAYDDYTEGARPIASLGSYAANTWLNIPLSYVAHNEGGFATVYNAPLNGQIANTKIRSGNADCSPTNLAKIIRLEPGNYRVFWWANTGASNVNKVTTRLVNMDTGKVLGYGSRNYNTSGLYGAEGQFGEEVITVLVPTSIMIQKSYSLNISMDIHGVSYNGLAVLPPTLSYFRHACMMIQRLA